MAARWLMPPRRCRRCAHPVDLPGPGPAPRLPLRDRIGADAPLPPWWPLTELGTAPAWAPAQSTWSSR